MIQESIQGTVEGKIGVQCNSMPVTSVASRSYLTDTSRRYSDRGYLVVVSELVLGRASDVGSSSYSVRLQNEK